MSGMAFGARQMTQLKNWIPTLATFGGCAALAGCYITDWQVVCGYIPFYNRKFKQDADE